MKVEKEVFYSVAPLDRSDVMAIVEELEASHHGGGIATFEVCRVVASRLPDPKLNSCAAREDRFRPCTVLCYVCIEVLYELLQRSWERDRE